MNDSHSITPSASQMEEAVKVFSSRSARIEALRSFVTSIRGAAPRGMARQDQIDAVIEIARALGVEVKQ